MVERKPGVHTQTLDSVQFMKARDPLTMYLLQFLLTQGIEQ